MSVPDRSIEPRLLAAAKDEFLKKGFLKTSLSDICRAAGVTTGALYKRYNGKEELFSALVSSTIQHMEEDISRMEKTDLASLTDQELYESFSLSPETNRKWLRSLYDHREGFTLLIRCSSGTRYADFHQNWSKQMHILDYKYYQEARKRGMISREITAEELQVLTFGLWSLYYEPFFKDFTWEQMERHAENVYLFLDWHSVLGMKKTE